MLSMISKSWVYICAYVRLTKKTTHALNMGSYNYLGFAQNFGKCADDAETAVNSCGLGICSSQHELGAYVFVSAFCWYCTHTHPFNGPFSGTTRVGRYQKVKTNWDFTEARDSEWQWHQLGHMQVCTSLQTDNHASTSPLSFLQAGCPSCHPTNSIKALTAICWYCSVMQMLM